MAASSSAELLVNALKPYASITQTGEKTLGKDMASFAINDQRSPQTTKLVLHPLVFKLYNAAGAGDYANGLAPQYTVNEFSELRLKPFGDSSDPLIKKVLELNGGALLVTKLSRQSSPGTGASTYLSTFQRSRNQHSIELRKIRHIFYFNK